MRKPDIDSRTRHASCWTCSISSTPESRTSTTSTRLVFAERSKKVSTTYTCIRHFRDPRGSVFRCHSDRSTTKRVVECDRWYPARVETDIRDRPQHVGREQPCSRHIPLEPRHDDDAIGGFFDSRQPHRIDADEARVGEGGRYQASQSFDTAPEEFTDNGETGCRRD